MPRPDEARSVFPLARCAVTGPNATRRALDAPLVVAPDIEAALRAAGAWEALGRFPELYRRVRVGSVEEMRRNALEFSRRLAKFVSETAAGRMFWQWNDGGLLGEEDAGVTR
jgi:hypothetical protein